MQPTKRVIVIGYTGPGDESYLAALHFLYSNDWCEFADAIDHRNKNVSFFDMASHPENGDGVLFITPDVGLVVALHLNGMKGQDPDPIIGEMYNVCNQSILQRCRRLGVPLLVVGDQPETINDLVVMYLSEGAWTMGGPV